MLTRVFSACTQKSTSTSGITREQAIVIENAPLGVKSAVAAGIFTIAVNTGILKDEELLQAGANCLYHDMMELRNDLLLFFSPS